MPVVVEVHADLAVEHDVQLCADVTLSEDRLSLDVMSRHHQAVDAGQLFQRKRAEEGHPFESYQLFHVLAGSGRGRLRGLLDPFVAVVRECFELGMGQWASRARVEGLGIEQLRQRPSKPARAEVYQRFQRLNPGLGLVRKEASLHGAETPLAVQSTHRAQTQMDPATDVVVETDAE